MDNQFKETIDYKSKKISKAMDAKEKSMAIMAAGRDAVLMITSIMQSYPATLNGKTNSEIEAEIMKWRNWFYYNLYTLDPDDQLEQEAKEKGEVSPF